MENMEHAKNSAGACTCYFESLGEIKNDGEYNPDKDESFIVGAQYFFNAFNSAVAVTENRDASLILSLAAKVPDI